MTEKQERKWGCYIVVAVILIVVTAVAYNVLGFLFGAGFDP